MDTPQPIPRTMLDRDAVSPLPPGSASSLTVAPSGWGNGIESVSVMQRATGETLSMICPVMSGSPVTIALIKRTSTGDLPAAAAILSICDSCAKQAWTTPKPRIAPHGGLLVRTAYPSTVALSHL